jgi:hypothetical protein
MVWSFFNEILIYHSCKSNKSCVEQRCLVWVSLKLQTLSTNMCPFFAWPPESCCLMGLQDLVREVDPDVIIGYNICKFDLPYLIEVYHVTLCLELFLFRVTAASVYCSQLSINSSNTYSMQVALWGVFSHLAILGSALLSVFSNFCPVWP